MKGVSSTYIKFILKKNLHTLLNEQELPSSARDDTESSNSCTHPSLQHAKEASLRNPRTEVLELFLPLHLPRENCCET